MKPERYTVMIVPDTAGSGRDFTISRKALRWSLVGGGVAIVLAMIALAVYLPRALRYDELKARNATLMEERFQVMRIMEDYNEMREMNSYIRNLLGSRLAPGTEGGRETHPVPLDSFQRSRVNRVIPELPHPEVNLLENVPSLAPVDGYVTQGFYDEAVFYDNNHLGLDVIARQGEVVKAAAGGLVIFSNWTYRYGNTVILAHGHGYVTVYSHNQRNVVKERQWVERGEPVAFLGNTGISRGPHLHFEIWKDGQPQDPKQYIFMYQNQDVSVKQSAMD